MELVVGAEHDLDLLDRAPVAGQDVVHARAHEAGPQLGEGPAQVGGLADVRAPLLEHDVVRAESPGGSPSRGERASPSRISVVAHRSAWAPASTPVDATSSSTTDASAPSPRTISVRPMSDRGRPDGPADDDRLGRRGRPRGRGRRRPASRRHARAARASRPRVAGSRRPAARGRAARRSRPARPGSGAGRRPRARRPRARRPRRSSSRSSRSPATPSGRPTAVVAEAAPVRA